MRLVVVGLGSIGRRHVRVIKRAYPNAEIVAVRTGRGGVVPEDKMVNTTVHQISDALDCRPNVGIIASPASLHVRQAIEFLHAGVPVLVEKPLSVRYDEALRLFNDTAVVSTAVSRSAIGFVLRHQPAFDYVKTAIMNGNLGSFRGAHVQAHSFLPSWRPDQDYRQSVSSQRSLGGGVLRELSHEIDYVLALFGRPRAVVAWRSCRSEIDIDAEDHVELMVKHEHDAVTTISLDFATDGFPRRTLHASFSRGSITWDLVSQSVNVEVLDAEPRTSVFAVERDEMFHNQLTNFLEVATGDIEPKCRLEDGLTVMAVIDAAEKSYTSLCWEAI